MRASLGLDLLQWAGMPVLTGRSLRDQQGMGSMLVPYKEILVSMMQAAGIDQKPLCSLLKQ